MKIKVLSVISFCILLLVSCEKSFFLPDIQETQNGTGAKNLPPDPCLTTFCPNNSTCMDGKCQCNQGFEGPLCANGYADKFVGSYQGSDTCDGQTYITILPLKVTKIDNQKIKIEEFGGFSSFIMANIEKENADSLTGDKLIIDFYDFVGRHFKGSGLLKNEDVHGIYTVTYPDGFIETCSFTMERL